MQGIPDFFEWIHICLAYDVFKDTYKIYKNGEKVESGSWSENPNVHTGCPKKSVFNVLLALKGIRIGLETKVVLKHSRFFHSNVHKNFPVLRKNA